MQENQDKNSVIEDAQTIIQGLKVEETGIPEDVKNEIWQNVEASTIRSNRRLKLRVLLRYVAVVALLVTATFYLYFNKNKEEQIDYETVITENMANEEASENVVIVLPNNEKIEIADKNVELIHDTEGRISVNSKVVGKESHPEASSAAFNQLLVPYGKTSNIVMSDGTKVWVNSGSRVVYPTTFDADKREIYIEGEVYLEVARNENCPFILKTSELEVKVLGTSFNVSAYKNDDTQSVVLATGSITAKGLNYKNDIDIRPNQKFTFENKTKESRLEKVDILKFISWKYGFLFCEKEKLTNVLKKVERYYNKPLSYNPAEMDHITLSGKLDLKENIEETFRIISITTPIAYTIESDEIKINVKP